MKLELQNLSVTYASRNGDVRAVRDCSFVVSRGDVVGLVGESGSGKTSALMAIPRLLPRGTIVTGRVVCDGQDIASLREELLNAWRWRRIALVPQGASASFTPHISIGGHITEVLAFHMNLTGADAKTRAVELLRTVGLEETFFGRYPHELSGGQKQRAALATALACGPDFLLADEPTTALDVVTQKEVLDMIVSLVRSRGMGLLLVTHDLPLAAGLCDKLVVMREGAVVESGASREVVENPQSPFTRNLIDALRRMESADALTGEGS
jgi:ABC-type glutathione transport system ATPase component